MNNNFDKFYIETYKQINEDSPCWDGYEKVPGKKDYEKGSCKKKSSKKKKQVNENTDFSIDELRSMNRELKSVVGDNGMNKKSPIEVWSTVKSIIDDEDDLKKYAKYIYAIEKYKYKRIPSEDKEGSIMSDPEAQSYIQNSTLNEKSFDKDKMKCNNPRYLKKGESGHGKKQKVVKACKNGKEKIVKFGDANMKNKSDNKKNRKNFRNRHSCDEKKDKFTAGYWACKDW